MTRTAAPTVRAERIDSLAVVVLDNPASHNAWSATMRDDYEAALADAVADPRIRAIVVTGGGRFFCPGTDLSGVTEGDSPNGNATADQLAPHGALKAPKPVIAAINGGCAGVGLVLALTCDVRFAASGARLSTAFARRGVIAEFGASWLLQRAIGTGAAADLLLSGRTIGAQEALALGLVQHVHPADMLLDEALRYATDIAAHCAPNALASIKRQLFDDRTRSWEAALADAATLMGAPRLDDAREGALSFMERRPPHFTDLRIDRRATEETR